MKLKLRIRRGAPDSGINLITARAEQRQTTNWTEKPAKWVRHIFKSLYALCVTGAVSWQLAKRGFLGWFRAVFRVFSGAVRRVFARQPQAAFLIAHTCAAASGKLKEGHGAGAAGKSRSSWKSWPEDAAALLELIRRGNYGTLKLILSGSSQQAASIPSTNSNANTHTHTVARILESCKVVHKCSARSAAST